MSQLTCCVVIQCLRCSVGTQSIVISNQTMANTKTPVTILQELMAKSKKPPPIYNYVENGVHFHCNVKADGLNAIGIGSTKKDAKHNAASNFLEKKSQSSTNHIPLNGESIQSENNDSSNLNVKYLCDMCSKYSLAAPEYVFLQESGPPHKRKFEVMCKAGSIVKRAIGLSKKEAKCIAAGYIIEHFKNNPPKESFDKLRDTENLNVSKLHEMCLKFGLPVPEYELLKETGLPNHKQFEIMCKSGSIERTATALSKKKARNIVAGSVLEYYTSNNIIPQEFLTVSDENENHNVVKLSSNYVRKANETALQKYADFSNVPHNLNFGKTTVFDYYLRFSSSLSVIQRAEIRNMLNNRDKSASPVPFVEKIFKYITIDFKWSEVKAHSGRIVSFIARKANPPFYVLKHGTNMMEAKKNCAEEVIEYIDLML